MLKMFPDCILNQRGIGLITAIFVIVVVGMFGVLISRYATISSVASAEDFYWAQALYSAQSSGQVRILYNDSGGTGTEALTTVSGFTTTVSVSGSVVQASAAKTLSNTVVQRSIEVHVAL